MSADRPCQICTEVFTPTNGRSRYCSSECRAEADRAKVLRHYYAHIDESRCAARVYQASKNAERKARRAPPTCKECSAAFEAADVRQQYCSLGCKAMARRRHRVKPSMPVKCGTCGEPFPSSNSKQRRYCSAVCAGAQRMAYQRQYADDNRERLKKYSRAYYAKNPTAIQANNRRWRENNPEKAIFVRIAISRRRRDAEGSHTGGDLQRIWLRQGKCCANPYCGVKLTKQTRHLDHIKPIAKAGTHWPHNLQWLCAPCNLRKSVKDPDAWLTEQARSRAVLARGHSSSSPLSPAAGAALVS